jgi:hypothetical protein
MAELTEDSVLGALEGAFGDAKPVAAPKVAPLPQQTEDEPPAAAEAEATTPAEGDEEGEPTEAKAEPEAAEPEYEIEVDGRVELVRGKEQVRELLQKGLDYSRKSEVNARQSELIAAHAQQLQFREQANHAILPDIAELQSIDSRLKAYEGVDWAAAFEQDALTAIKVKNDRDQLRELRERKVREIGQKQQSFEQGQAQAAQQLLMAEEKALLAKLPTWRNSEKAAQEKRALGEYLTQSGYQQSEISGLTDHRALLIARKAWLYDQLQAAKDDKVKQVRTAPAMAKPGAASTQQAPNEKAAFAKFQQELRAQGKKGNHNAQEQLMLKALNRAFK